jgi:hypothetical protein
MPIDMPPAIDQQYFVTETHAKSAYSRVNYLIDVAGRSFMVSGNKYLSEYEVRLIAANTKDYTMFARNLLNEYRAKGHPLVFVNALPSMLDHYLITVSEKKISKITGDENITKYFIDLIGKEYITDDDIYIAAKKAKIIGDRTGSYHEIRYKSLSTNDVEMIFTTKKDTYKRNLSGLAGVRRTNTEYQGDTQAYASGKYDFSNGAQFGMAFVTTVNGDKQDSINDAEALQFKADYPSIYGVYGIEGSASSYRISSESVTRTDGHCHILNIFCSDPSDTVSEDKLSGNIFAAQLHGTQYAFISNKQTIEIRERLLRTNSSFDSKSTGETIADEKYSQASIGVLYTFNNPTNTSLIAEINAHYAFDYTSETSNPWVVGASGYEGQDYINSSNSTFYTAKVKAKQNLYGNFYIEAGFDGQYSGEALPIQSKMRIGGDYGVRAFNTAILRGDTGNIVDFNLGTTWLIEGVSADASIFVEHGTSKLNGGTRRTISDAGLAFKLSTKHFFTTLSYSVPTGDENIEDLEVTGTETFLWNVGAKF